MCDDIFRIDVAHTNFHVKCNPTRADDSEKFQLFRNGLHAIAQQQVESRRRTLRRYQERRRIRINHQFRR